MDMFNDAMREAFRTGRYICNQCGADMVFEDEIMRDTLVCENCGNSMELDHYGFTDEEYEQLYPTWEELMAREGIVEEEEDDDEEDEEDTGEYYEEEYDELSRD